MLAVFKYLRNNCRKEDLIFNSMVAGLVSLAGSKRYCLGIRKKISTVKAAKHRSRSSYTSSGT